MCEDSFAYGSYSSIYVRTETHGEGSTLGHDVHKVIWCRVIQLARKWGTIWTLTDVFEWSLPDMRTQSNLCKFVDTRRVWAMEQRSSKKICERVG